MQVRVRPEVGHGEAGDLRPESRRWMRAPLDRERLIAYGCPEESQRMHRGFAEDSQRIHTGSLDHELVELDALLAGGVSWPQRYGSARAAELGSPSGASVAASSALPESKNVQLDSGRRWWTASSGSSESSST